MHTCYSIFIFLIVINSALLFSIEVKTNVIVDNDSNNKTNSEGNKIKISIDVPDIIFNETATQNITANDNFSQYSNAFQEKPYNRTDKSYTKDNVKQFELKEMKTIKTNAYKNLKKHLLALMKSNNLLKKRSVFDDADQKNNTQQFINKSEENEALTDNQNYEKDIEEFIKHQYKTHIKSKKLNMKNKTGINKDNMNITDQLINNYYQTVSSSESSSSESVGTFYKNKKKIRKTKSKELPYIQKDKKKLLPGNKMLLNETYQKILKDYGIDSKNKTEPYVEKNNTERTENISDQIYHQNNPGILNLYYKILKLLESPKSPESKKLNRRKFNFMGNSNKNIYYVVKSNKSHSDEENKLHSKYQIVSESNEEYPDDPLVFINNHISKKQKQLKETGNPIKTNVFYGSDYDINVESSSEEGFESKETKVIPIHSEKNINQIKGSFHNEHRLNNSKEIKDRIREFLSKIIVNDPTLKNNDMSVAAPEKNLKQQLPQQFEYMIDMIYNENLLDNYSVENKNYTTNKANKKFGTDITASYKAPNKQNDERFQKDMKSIINFLKLHQNELENFKKKKNTNSNLQGHYVTQKIIKLQNKKIPNTKKTYLILNNDPKTKNDKKNNGEYFTDQEPKCNITNQIVVSDNLMSSFIAYMNAMKNNANISDKDRKTSEVNIKFDYSYETILQEFFTKLENIQETLKNNTFEKDKYHHEFLKALQQVTSGDEGKPKDLSSVLNIIFVLNTNMPNDIDEYENKQESLEMTREDAISNEIKRAVDNLINAVKSQHSGNLFNENFATSVNKNSLFASILNKINTVQDTGSPNHSQLFKPKEQEHLSLPNETFPSIDHYISETTDLAKLDKNNSNNVLPNNAKKDMAIKNLTTEEQPVLHRDPKDDESEDVSDSEHSFLFSESDSDENTSWLLPYEEETLHIPIEDVKSTISPDLSKNLSDDDKAGENNKNSSTPIVLLPSDIDNYESDSSQYSMDSNSLAELAHSDEYEIQNKPLTATQSVLDHLDSNNNLNGGNFDDDSIQNTNEKEFTLSPNPFKNENGSFLSTTNNILQGLTELTTPKEDLFNSIENISKTPEKNDAKLTLDEYATQISKTLEGNKSASVILISDIVKNKNISVTNTTVNNLNMAAYNLQKLKLNQNIESSASDSDESNEKNLHDLDPDDYLTHISDTSESDSASDNSKESSVENIEDDMNVVFNQKNNSQEKIKFIPTRPDQTTNESMKVNFTKNVGLFGEESKSIGNKNNDTLNLSKILSVQKNNSVNSLSSSNAVDDFFDDYQIEKDTWAVLHHDKVPQKKLPEENNGDYFSVINLDHNDMDNKKKKKVNSRHKRNDGVISITTKIGYKKAKWPHNKKYIELSSGSKEGMNSLYVICEANEIRINGRCVKTIQAKRHP